ncbi:DNA helicase [Arthrobacter phage Thunderclap]|uniref:DNA helicase n=5 Tax=Amigovirus amigo TaxID=1982100 RepID=A0A0U4K0Z0_9CAUD|nr:DNA helicase [Arthrobacter phage Anansi]ALY09127.1 DNA helicase [Arthrobacter phage Gorgeous]ALY10146.1 DNA helicase [Arthrobacter phage Rings]ALY10408.1 DNA helicase [Arthrobacter phage SorJuana]QOR56123.1 DNA helicase [Arthrobacter phage Thunderclap]
MEPLVPRPKQEFTINRIIEDKSHMCGSLGGFGKTLVGAEAILRTGVQRVLIVCPLKVIRNWDRALKQQSGGKHPGVKQVAGDKQGTLNFLDMQEGKPGVYIVGWEFFRTLLWGSYQFDFAIADECHRAANWKSKQSDSLRSVRAAYKVAFSGTPAGNKTEGLFGTLRWLWPDRYPHYWPWVGHFFHKAFVEQHVGGGKTKKLMNILGEKTPGAAWDDIPSKTRFASEQINEVINHIIEVPMKPTQRRIYNDFEKEAFVWLGENPMYAQLPAVKSMRLRQMALGVPIVTYDSEGEPVVSFDLEAKSGKIEALADLLSDLHAGGPIPVMVYTHSRKFVEVVVHQLRQKGYRAVGFVGGQTHEEVNAKIDGFGVDHDIIVATIGSIGEGVDRLQLVCNTEVWLSLDDNRLLNRQAQWRLDRTGQLPQPINRYLIRSLGTIETEQHERIANDDAILDESMEIKMEVDV